MLQPSEEIKSKLDIVDVIREYIPIKAAGMNFKANCPFHREKTPSFMVSPEKQIYHCFGCGKGGDVFSFIQEIEGVNFVEALRILAPKAGVTLKKQNPQVTSQRNKLLDIMDSSVNYYHDILLNNSEAQAARDYLKNRGLTEETIREWKIGYSADSWDDIINWLKARNYNDNEIFSAGISIKKEGTNRYYNRFRGRIMFPIWDNNGNAVAFSARVSPEKEATEQMGKYINSPQTLIYDKSKILFGLDKAKLEIKSQDLAIVVEGQMDVITAHQAGYKNIIASSGTALTREQINLIKRFTNNITLAFDMDNAGQMAADRGIREAMQAEMNIKVIELGEGKDPDECIKNNPKEWERAVEEAKPMMQYYFDKNLADLNLEKIEDKRIAAKKLLPIIIRLGDNIEKDYWLKVLAEKLDTNESALRESINGIKDKIRDYQRSETSELQEVKTEAPKNRQELLSEMLIALMFKFPAVITYVVDHISVDHLKGVHNQSIYKNLLIYYNNNIDGSASENLEKIDYNEFKFWFDQQIEENIYNNSGFDKQNVLMFLDRLVLLGDRDFYNLDNEKAKNETIKVVVEIKRNYLTARMKEIEKLIIESEKAGDKAGVNGLMEELKTLSDELRSVQ